MMFVITLSCSNWYGGSDVLKAVVLKNTALWDVTPGRMKQCSALGGRKSRLETAQYSETSLSFCQITAVTCQKAVLFILMV
jgi:hypothetical protein